MVYLILNSILYIILFSYIWKKNGLSPGSILVGLWTIIAVCGVLYYPTDPYFIGHITLWPLLYLFITFFLFARYFFNNKITKQIRVFAFSRSKFIDSICIIYVICVVINILSDELSLQQIAFNNVIENASEAYKDHFTNEKEYASVWLQLTHSYEYYVWYIALIAVFNSLCQGRRLFGISLLFVVFAKRMMDSVVLGERTFIVVNVFILLALYSMYYNYIEKETRKIIYYIAAVLGTFIGLYLLAVTISRFDNSDYGVGGSFMHYLGTPMLRFDYGVVDSIRRTFGGAATFNGVLERLGFPPIVDIDFRAPADVLLGTHFETGFNTFIGSLYVDFGFFLTFILALFWPTIIWKLIFFNGKLSLPGMYIFLFYFNRLSRGAFATGYGAGILYYQAFAFYVILWLLVLLTSKRKVRYRSYDINCNANI